MKTHVAVAATAVMAALLRPSDALRIKRETMEANTSHRNAVHYTLQFEECKGKSPGECENIINQMLKDDPKLFDGQDHLTYVVQHKRQAGDPNYYKLGLMTDMSGKLVVGINGDGIVRFSNPNFDGQSVWCLSDTPCLEDHNRLLHIEDKCCFALGPWDCDTGVPKTVDACCDMIKATAPGADHNGNSLSCHPSYPLGSDLNPVEPGRVYMRVNNNGRVVGDAINE